MEKLLAEQLGEEISEESKQSGIKERKSACKVVTTWTKNLMIICINDML